MTSKFWKLMHNMTVIKKISPNFDHTIFKTNFSFDNLFSKFNSSKFQIHVGESKLSSNWQTNHFTIYSLWKVRWFRRVKKFLLFLKFEKCFSQTVCTMTRIPVFWLAYGLTSCHAGNVVPTFSLIGQSWITKWSGVWFVTPF